MKTKWSFGSILWKYIFKCLTFSWMRDRIANSLCDLSDVFFKQFPSPASFHSSLIRPLFHRGGGYSSQTSALPHSHRGVGIGAGRRIEQVSPTKGYGMRQLPVHFHLSA